MSSANWRPTDIRERDIAFFRGLFESRLMTVNHAAALYFNGSREAAKKRIQKLKSKGLIDERPRRPYQPSVLFLTRRGFALLWQRGAVTDYPHVSWSSFEHRARISELTLAHELEVMDVKAALCTAVAASSCLYAVEFSTWPLLFQFYAAPAPGARSTDEDRILVRPDGFIRIHEEEADGELSEHTFFLEVDRSTEPQETLAQRARCYADYYRSGGLAARYGYDREKYKEFPFRALMVFKNAERRNNTAERILQGTPPILMQVWLTTASEFKQDSLGAIWVRPLDYREVTQETPYDPELRRGAKGYRRQPEREQMVEETIQKHRLFAEGDEAA